MQWVPAVVARFARGAGFAGDELVPAVAVALATSDGDDLWHQVNEPGPSYDGRGLWGVDVVEAPELADLDLYDPRVNATAAHSLSAAAGGSLAWSPVFRSGAWRWRLSEATEAVSVREPRQPVGSAGALDVLDGGPHDPRRQLAEWHAFMRDRINERGR